MGGSHSSWATLLGMVGLGSGGENVCEIPAKGDHEAHGEAERLGGFG